MTHRIGQGRGGWREELVGPHSRFLPHTGTVQQNEAFARVNRENVARFCKGGSLSVSNWTLAPRQSLGGRVHHQGAERESQGPLTRISE